MDSMSPVCPNEINLGIVVRGTAECLATSRGEQGRNQTMRTLLCLAAAGLLLALAQNTDAACCYFSAKNADILQPAQKVFITWNPEEKVESFTVQPKFEGNADD